MPTATPYSSSDTSLCYKQFYDVYQKSKNLTQEEKEIAVWWADDPSFTYSPAGHSYNTAKIIVKDQKPDLVKSVDCLFRSIKSLNFIINGLERKPFIRK